MTDTAKPQESLVNAMTDLQRAGFGSVAWIGTAWLENMSDVGAELMSFVADRVKEDVKTQHEILACKDMAEVQKIQAKFMRKAIEQYTAETGKLVDMGNEMLTALQEKMTKPAQPST